MFGYKSGAKRKQRFVNGELIRLIGEAELGGVASVKGVALNAG